MLGRSAARAAYEPSTGYSLIPSHLPPAPRTPDLGALWHPLPEASLNQYARYCLYLSFTFRSIINIQSLPPSVSFCAHARSGNIYLSKCHVACLEFWWHVQLSLQKWSDVGRTLLFLFLLMLLLIGIYPFSFSPPFFHSAFPFATFYPSYLIPLLSHLLTVFSFFLSPVIYWRWRGYGFASSLTTDG
jgi:hypothetical protein